MLNNQVLFIAGPTATGKTALADEIAQKFDGELISADSRQVYKGLDIVTGKDLPKSKIHGLDLVTPNQDWNAGLFRQFALRKIKEIQSRGRLPIIVGGTGLYIKSLLTPFNPPTPNPKLRHTLEKLSLSQLQTRLKKLNPTRFSQLNHSDLNNPRRLIRALEISHANPIPPKLEEKASAGEALDLNFLLIVLAAPLEVLENKIKKRVEKRLAADPKEELEYLESFNLAATSSPATSLGYSELKDYYDGKLTKEQLIQLWTTRERQYAKRQLTWFKKQPDVHWLEITDALYRKKVVAKVASWYSHK